MRALAAALAFLAAASPAAAQLTSPPLEPAEPRVTRLEPHRPTAPLRGPRDWRGRRARLAGTAHYGGGEWIYEDYPFTAYGAAPPGMLEGQESLATLSEAFPPSARIQGGLAEVVATTGAGPFAEEADLFELRLAVRGPRLHVLARMTTMRAPVRSALLLLFDTRPGAGARAVPFGSGLETARGDVAVLVTAAGARIVDLAGGAARRGAAAAHPEGYVNALTARLPLARVAAGGELRLVAATGLADSFSLESLAKVAPRFTEPVQSVHEREQALALARHDIDGFFTAVSLRRLRRGDRERLRPGAGYSVRTMRAPAQRSKQEGGTDGTLRDYGLYVPAEPAGAPAPATLLLRGSGMTAHSLAAITPALVSQLGDDNGAIVVSPGGRSGFDLFEGAAYRDAEQALADARRLVGIDRNRITVAGYSMGGYATYMLAATRPDRYAGAFVIEGPVGGAQPATKSPVVFAFPDLVPMLANLAHTPVAIHQTDHDSSVPISNALAAAQRLRELALRYRLDVYPGDHFTPGVINDYTIGVRYLSGVRRAAPPSTVRLTRSLPFERAIDTGELSDAPLAGTPVGLRFDRAWFVRRLEPTDAKDGTATIDVRTLARPGDIGLPARSVGVTPGEGAGGAPPSAYEEQTWSPVPAGALGNAFVARLRGAASVRLRLAGMGLTRARPLRATIVTTDPVKIALGPCVLRLARGEHRLVLQRYRTVAPCGLRGV